jgi:hypothetical protein
MQGLIGLSGATGGLHPVSKDYVIGKSVDAIKEGKFVPQGLGIR